MNVTVKMNDQLVKGARHRAVDDGLSLSGWLAALVSRELATGQGSGVCGGLIQALGNDDMAEREVDFDRDRSDLREVKF